MSAWHYNYAWRPSFRFVADFERFAIYGFSSDVTLFDWLSGMREENDAAIERVSKALDACRFRDWKEL